MAAPTQEREMQLLQNVDFKILGVANDEKKLADLLQRYLPPLLLKAASEHAVVRSEVLKIVTRLNTFVRPPSVVLPVEALLGQYKSSTSALVKQLDLAFIQHSLERIDDHDRRGLIPKALQGISQDEGRAQAKTFFTIVLRLLLDLRIPPRGSSDDTKFRDSIGLGSAADAKFLSSMIGTFLTLRFPSQGSNRKETWAQANSEEASEYFDFENENTLKLLQKMSELKVKLVVFLASAAFTDEEKFLPAVYGASSFDNRVSETSEEIIKRSSASLEDENLIRKLFKVHNQLDIPYRIRILNLLSKSAISVSMQEQVLSAVDLDFQEEQREASRSFGQPSVSGPSRLERTKLFKALFQYLSWVAKMAPAGEHFTLAPDLISRIRHYIELQGWPKPAERLSPDEVLIRSQAYEALGMFGRRSEYPAQSKLDLGLFLFESLGDDPTSEVVVNIDGALSSLAGKISGLSTDSEYEALLSMLFAHMNKITTGTTRNVRHAVVKWANQCLTFSDVKARWIDLLAVGGRQDERNDVLEQGRKGLDPWTYYAHDDKRPELPNWEKMVACYFYASIRPQFEGWQVSGESASTRAYHKMDEDDTEQKPFANFRPHNMRAVPVALQYIKSMLLLSALPDFVVGPNWSQGLEARLSRDIAIRQKVKQYLENSDLQIVSLFLRSCLNGSQEEDSTISEGCLQCFVDIASLCPQEAIAPLTTESYSWLIALVQSNNKHKRTLASSALGILACHPSYPTTLLNSHYQVLASSLDGAAKAFGSKLNAAEGSLLAASHLKSRLVYYDRQAPFDFDAPLVLFSSEPVPASLFETGLEAFSQLWSAGLGLPGVDSNPSLGTVLDRLTSEAKKGNERAIMSMGRLALSLEDDNGNTDATDVEEALSQGHVAQVLKVLFELHELKQVEIHFTIGDAITAAIARWDSDHVKLTLDIDSKGTFRLPARPHLVKAVLEKLFKDCKGTKPALLKASGIWLFCIVQYCSHLPEVQARLREAQAAFMRLLNARDELVQETASRGLSLVYERGDSDLKSTLVKDLVSAFTGSGPQLKVEEDTELFEPGALPTGEGKSVTSYKDIMNLANEVGDQGLVYKFMSLAANAATWSTRSAFGRFGLSNILSDSEVDPKLYPKLFRYRFDPNQNVQRSMESIWKALVKDTGKALDTHFDAIIEDLLKNILGREWRVRQASCAAISDLLQSRPFPQYEKYYREVWISALKVLDDVKGSVREAAERLCRTLSNSLVRQLEDGGSGTAAKAMMKEALPFLLSEKGVESSVEDVQAFATITVIKITKEGGQSLKPFIAEMVPQLLGLLSSIEPQQINYYYQRLGEDNREKLDKIRSQMVGQSPISEAIENCLRLVDKEVMADMTPRLESTIKTAIGFSTKIGCCRVIQTLCTRHIEDIKPSASSLLKVMEKQTMDKNDEVSKAYAGAAAYLIRHVSSSAKQRFCNKFVEMYFKSEEESRRQKVADVIFALGKVSPDHFSSQETVLLPFTYLGSRDTDEYTSKVFKEVWEQHAGSNRTVVRYVTDIAALVERCLDTQQWAVRHTGAFAVADLLSDVCAASEATGDVGKTNLEAMWPAFDKALALKTFTGKEKILESLPKFVEKGHSLWKENSTVAAQLRKIALREANRQNDEYRVHAFSCLWKFAKARDDLDMLEDIATIVIPHLDELKNEDKMKVDSDNKDQLGFQAAQNGLEAIARGYQRSKLPDALADVIGLLKPYLSHVEYSTIRRETWYGCVEDAMKEAVKTEPRANSTKMAADQVWQSYIESLDLDRADVGTEMQRIGRANAVAAMIQARKEVVVGGAAQVDGLESLVRKALTEERSLDVQRAWKAALDII